MKRLGNLYKKIYDIDNIRLAHHNASKGKKYYDEVKVVDANLEEHITKIYNMLKDKTFKNSEYYVFKRDFNGKEREIFKLPYFPDRIIHHCIMQVTENIWRRSLIRDTYSSIKGRGLHDGVRRIKNALKDVEGTKYCLKLDIKKFYPSINHDILKKIIRKKIKCQDTLWLLDEIIESTKGVPIGNYLSQYFGNIYLSGLDHFVKEEFNIKYYFRYCDDIVILSNSKNELWFIFQEINNYCKNIVLSLKENYQIFPVDIRGIDFLGYRFFHNFTLLRKSIALRFKRKIKLIKNKHNSLNQNIINSIMSYYGWMKHGDCQQLFIKYIDTDIQTIVANNCALLNHKNPLEEVLT
jgi:RNA-directed DNA polymerase